MNNHGMGALPPEGMEWVVGKTAASICFVGDAERILAESKLSSETAQRVRDRVERVKEGKEVIDRFMTEQEIVLEAI
jgi:hypothetical protein